jgi:hypothetical protein
MSAPRPVRARVVDEPTCRASIDWPRLFAEGARLEVRGYPTSTLVEAYDERTAVVALLVRVPKDQVEAVKQQGLILLDLVRTAGQASSFPGILPLLIGFGRR